MTDTASKRVWIESPYSANPIPADVLDKNRWWDIVVERNEMIARSLHRFAALKGFSPSCSHLLLTQKGILDDKNPAERSIGISAGLDWQDVCDELWVFTSYGISKGMRQGMLYFLETNERLGLDRALVEVTIDEKGQFILHYANGLKA